MIQVKLKDLFLCNQKKQVTPDDFADSILETLFKETKLPILARHNISRLIPEIERELNVLEKLRVDLIKQYGECINEDAQQWAIKQGTDEFKLFETEWNQVLDTSIDLPGNKLLIMDFKDTNFNSHDIYLLSWLVLETDYPDDFNETLN